MQIFSLNFIVFLGLILSSGETLRGHVNNFLSHESQTRDPVTPPLHSVDPNNLVVFRDILLSLPLTTFLLIVVELLRPIFIEESKSMDLVWATDGELVLPVHSVFTEDKLSE